MAVHRRIWTLGPQLDIQEVRFITSEFPSTSVRSPITVEGVNIGESAETPLDIVPPSCLALSLCNRLWWGFLHVRHLNLFSQFFAPWNFLKLFRHTLFDLTKSNRLRTTFLEMFHTYLNSGSHCKGYITIGGVSASNVTLFWKFLFPIWFLVKRDLAWYERNFKRSSNFGMTSEESVHSNQVLVFVCNLNKVMNSKSMLVVWSILKFRSSGVLMNTFVESIKFKICDCSRFRYSNLKYLETFLLGKREFHIC